MWRRSSYCGNGPSCVEVVAPFTASCSSHDNCVEVAGCTCRRDVLVRDSKNPGPVLTFDRDRWAEFIDAVKAEQFGPASPKDTP